MIPAFPRRPCHGAAARHSEATTIRTLAELLTLVLDEPAPPARARLTAPRRSDSRYAQVTDDRREASNMTEDPPARVVGFIGLGAMGAHMVARLIDAGHDVAVFDTREEAMAPHVARGARACP